MASTSTEVSIKELPTVTSIEAGNFLVVQTDNATTKVDFKDFVVGLDNTTFKSTINTLTSRVNAIYTTPDVRSLSSTNRSVTININGTNYYLPLQEA